MSKNYLLRAALMAWADELGVKVSKSNVSFSHERG